ncbi:MAG: helix-turn-helix domain-containing protein [Propionicimonas sp.]
MTQLDRVFERLTEDLPALSALVADLVHREQESYREISNESLYLAVHRNMQTAVRVLRNRPTHPREHLVQVTQTIRERHQSGIPMEEAVRAFALCVWQIHQRFLEVCTEEGIDRDEVLDGSNALWRLGDAITTQVVTVYNDLDLKQLLLDAHRRGELIRRLLAGLVSGSEMKELGLDRSGRYAAVRCTSAMGLTAADQRQLEQTGSLPGTPAVLAIVEGECLGLVACPPQPPAGVLVAMGTQVPLTEVTRSFEIADRVSHVARHAGLSGVQALENLTWRVAAVDQPELARVLRSRILEPLEAEGGFGAELEASVRGYLDQQLSISRAAAAQNLHVNTMRYRLRRFEEITGTSLADPADLVDVIWALSIGNLPPRPARL